MLKSTGKIGDDGPHKPEDRRAHLLVYYYIFFCQGLYSNSLGTMIPFLSEAYHIPQTEYSFLFMARTIGSLIGIVLYRYIHKHQYQHLEHKILTVSGLFYLVFMIAFVEWSSKFGWWLSMSFTGGAYFCTITAANICILLIVADKKGVEVIVGYALFGVGALLAPQIIGIFEEKAYFFMSFFYLGISIMTWWFPMPTSFTRQQHQQKQMIKGSSKLQMLFVLAFFLIVGMELTTMGWIPSYAVMNGACSKAEAVKYGTIYYILVVILRFGIPKVPGTNTCKLRFMIVSMLLSSIICLVFQQHQMYSAVAMFGSIAFGLTVSVMYPLALVVAAEYGISFQPSQTANMMTASVFSSGLLTGLTGLLMTSDINYLIYSFILISASMLVTFLVIFDTLETEAKPGAGVERELLQLQIGSK